MIRLSGGGGRNVFGKGRDYRFVVQGKQEPDLTLGDLRDGKDAV